MADSPSDVHLVAEARAGSGAAFDELVDRYWTGARALAYQRTRNWSDAEDAAQEAFVLAFRKLHLLRDPERFGGWLFTIVARSCVEVARRKARRPALLEDAEVVLSDAGEPEMKQVDQETVRTEINEAIGTLPERYRAVVVLRYGQDMSVKAIGKTLGLPVGTVVSQMFRANRLLRARLGHLVSDAR